MTGPRAMVLAAFVAAICAFASPAPAQERDPGVSEEITVFEAQVTVDASGLGPIDRQRLRPDQILLLEGGLPRRVTNLEALGTGGWRILLYFDAPTSRARTVKLAAQRLGSLARQLTDLGSVEVVMADPEPHTVLEAGREPTPLADRLARIAASEAGSDRDQDAASGLHGPRAEPRHRRIRDASEALRREVELVRGQVDRLILRAARGCDAEPCALFLVSDGFYEDPSAFYLGEHRLAGIGETRPLEEASQELAQTVAGLRVDRVPDAGARRPHRDAGGGEATQRLRRLPRSHRRHPPRSQGERPRAGDGLGEARGERHADPPAVGAAGRRQRRSGAARRRRRRVRRSTCCPRVGASTT